MTNYLTGERIEELLAEREAGVAWPLAGREALSLLSEVKQRRAQAVPLVNQIDALRAYVRHEPMCKAALYPGIGACTCGLKAVLAEATGRAFEVSDGQ